MNILFFYNSTLDPIKGGIGRVSHVLSDNFESKGHKVFFLSRIKNSDFDCDRQYYLPDSKNYNTPDNINYLYNFLKNHEIDVVINQSGMGRAASQFIYKVKDKNVPLLSAIHNSLLGLVQNFSSAYYDKASKYKIQWLLPITNTQVVKSLIMSMYKRKYRNHYLELCQNSDKIILLSDQFIPEMEFFVGKTYSSKMIGISNPTSFSVENAEELLENKKRELLYVGVINFFHKKVDLLLQIWHKVSPKYPDWKLRIVGDGRDMDKLKNLSSDLVLSNVYFEGYQNPKKYYEDASIFCMTSSSEGFGIVLVEAMQHAVVPVAFDSYASVGDIIDNDENGVLITPFKLDEYHDQLCKLIEDREYRNKLAKSAIEKAKNFSVDSIAKQWINEIENNL